MSLPILAQANNQPYNLQIGQVTLRAEAVSKVSYNDNINLVQTGRESDWIFTPSVNVHGLWQATELNVLTFDLGGGYQKYLIHSNNDSFLLTPDSQVQFMMFVGDFKITFKDALSYQDNPVDVGQLSGVSQFPVFTNDASIGVDWDIGDLTAGLSYSHANFLVLDSSYNYLDYQSDTVSPQVTYKFTKTIQAGFGASLSSTRYEQNVENDSTELSVGPFGSAQLSENLAVIARAGWEFSNYAQGGTNGDSSNISTYYGSAGITHRINDSLTEAVSFGREFLPGLTSNYTERYYANYTPSWHATSLFDIAPQIWWEHLQDSAATVSEISTRYGLGLTIGFALTQHSTVAFGYNYVNKDSNLSGLSYAQDQFTLGLHYKF